MDTRTRREKLAAMAAQSVSPEEARVASTFLESLPPDPPKRTLSRTQILGTPDDDRPAGSRRVWDRSRRAYVIVDIADLVARAFAIPLDLAADDMSSPYDWDGVE